MVDPADGRLTASEVVTAYESIAAIGTADPESAHEAEDKLWADVLATIAAHSDDLWARELAAVAASTSQIEFPRWRA